MKKLRAQSHKENDKYRYFKSCRQSLDVLIPRKYRYSIKSYLWSLLNFEQNYELQAAPIG